MSTKKSYFVFFGLASAIGLGIFFLYNDRNTQIDPKTGHSLPLTQTATKEISLTNKPAPISATIQRPPEHNINTASLSDEPISFTQAESDILEIAKIAENFNVTSEDIFEVRIKDSVFTDVEINDLVNLPIPGEEAIEMYVSDKISEGDKSTVKGHVDGLDIGFGVSLIKNGDYLSGYIITPSFQYELITVGLKTYLLRNNHEGGRSFVPNPGRE